MLEAEVKLALDAARWERLTGRLCALGATRLGSHRQVDTYFAHPGRDFRSTDEALRLRTEDGVLRVTYKGPKLDPPRKTREEIEFALDTDLETASRLLERLGFRAVAQVSKQRQEYRLDGSARVTVGLDRVDDLGWFCEVETAATTIVEGRTVLRCALDQLELGDLAPIPESYLELLLAGRG